MNLTAEQLFLISFVTSALIVFLKLLYAILAKQKLTLPDWAMRAIVYAVSLGIATLFSPPSIPTLPSFFGDFTQNIILGLNYATRVFMVLSGLFVAAHLIYTIVLKRVQDAIGERIAPHAF